MKDIKKVTFEWDIAKHVDFKNVQNREYVELDADVKRLFNAALGIRNGFMATEVKIDHIEKLDGLSLLKDKKIFDEITDDLDNLFNKLSKINGEINKSLSSSNKKIETK